MSQNNEIAEWCSQWKNGWSFLLYYAFIIPVALAAGFAYKALRNGALLLPVIFLALVWFDVGTVRQVLIQAPQEGVRVAVKYLCYAALAGGLVITVAEIGIRDIRRFLDR